MKKALLLGLTLTIIACVQKNRSFGTLTGTIKNLKNDTVLCLINYDSDELIQKIVVKKGKFKIKYSAPCPTQYLIRPEIYTYDKDQFILWLDNSTTKMLGNMYNLSDSKIEGSISNKIYDEYKIIEKTHDNILFRINMAKRISSNQMVLDSLNSESIKLESDYKKKLMQFFSNNSNSIVAFNYLILEITRYKSILTKADLEELYNYLPEDFKITKDGIILKDYISMPDIPKIGGKYIDFSQSTPEGKIESISSNLGKYTILEFWSSSCGNCRIEHPRLRKLYEKYHHNGLNIIGISLDDNLSNWIGAIEKDSIPWLNISDLNGYRNEGALLNGAKLIPCLILLDNNGIILDNNFRSKYMEGELEKLFKY